MAELGLAHDLSDEDFFASAARLCAKGGPLHIEALLTELAEVERQAHEYYRGEVDALNLKLREIDERRAVVEMRWHELLEEAVGSDISTWLALVHSLISAGEIPTAQAVFKNPCPSIRAALETSGAKGQGE